MQLLDFIEVRGGQDKRIELYEGDLTDLSPDEAFDLLVVSAFPGDYLPTATSLIGALNRKGLSVARLADDKEVDLRDHFSCWLSRPFAPPDPRLRFERILCFESSARGTPPETVGDIFRALTPIVAERPEIESIAMPALAAGNQGYPAEAMLLPLVQAALAWLERGLPLRRIKIVVRMQRSIRAGKRVFAAEKKRHAAAEAIPVARPFDYDVFISYARENVKESEVLERLLLEARPDLRIFVDRKEIDVGAAWQLEIFESLDRCRKVVALLSPAYLSSKVCKEEFNIAWIRARDGDEQLIVPMYVYSTALPSYMKYRNYIDCREGDGSRLMEASRKILNVLAASPS